LILSLVPLLFSGWPSTLAVAGRGAGLLPEARAPGTWVALVRSAPLFVMHWMSPVRDDRYGDGSSSEADAALWQSSGPDEIAAELTRRFRDRLRFFAARRLRDREAAEDVAQEVLRRTLEALRAGRVEKREALPAFLFQTARHVCMQRARSGAREARALERMGSGEEETGHSESENPLTELIGEERRRAVRAALQALDAEDRDLLLMSYDASVETAEIGRRLGITAGAVRVRRHRAVRRLAELLGVTKPPEREL
jgi:RNA polymerase sigma-70 factor, ECF subfamily